MVKIRVNEKYKNGFIFLILWSVLKKLILLQNKKQAFLFYCLFYWGLQIYKNHGEVVPDFVDLCCLQ